MEKQICKSSQKNTKKEKLWERLSLLDIETCYKGSINMQTSTVPLCSVVNIL